MKPVLFSFLLLVAVAPSASAQAPLFVVRHAEKAEGGDAKDPDLSEQGRARATRLAEMLRDAGITSIFVTELKRTQQTAEPLAKAAHAPVEIVTAKDPAALVAKVTAKKESALIVGHSNTVPEIIKLLGVQITVSLRETDYDNLFVVIRDPEPRLLRLHY